MQVEGFLAHGLDGRDNDGHVIGQATSHDRVDGDLFRGDDAVACGDHAQDVVGELASVFQEFFYLVRRGWHDG